jgi:hypothetical protein
MMLLGIDWFVVEDSSRKAKLVVSLYDVGFPISTKNKNLVYDHPMNISAKFDSNLFCGFRKKDENLQSNEFLS